MSYKHRIIMFSAFALVCVLVTFAPHAQAQGDPTYPIGKVIEIEGKASSSLGNKKGRGLKKDDPVYMNSLLQTHKDSRLLVLFIDDTSITLAEESALTVDEYVFDPYEASENEGQFTLAEGAVHWVSGMLSKSEQPKVRICSPQGSIGIRGTEFFGGMFGGGHGVFVEDGLVSYEGKWGIESISAGQGVFFSDTQTAEKQSWTSAMQETAMKMVSFSDDDAVQDKVKYEKRENIRKRHDYRGRMYPYKENPLRPRFKADDDEFFSDDFDNLKNR